MPEIIIHGFVVTGAKIKVQQLEEATWIFSVNLLDFLNDAAAADGGFRQPDFALIMNELLGAQRSAIEIEDKIIIIGVRTQLHGGLQQRRAGVLVKLKIRHSSQVLSSGCHNNSTQSAISHHQA